MVYKKASATDQYLNAVYMLEQNDVLPTDRRRFPCLVNSEIMADNGAHLLAINAIQTKPRSPQEAAMGPAAARDKIAYIYVGHKEIITTPQPTEQTSFRQGAQLDIFLDGHFKRMQIDGNTQTVWRAHVMEILPEFGTPEFEERFVQ